MFEDALTGNIRVIGFCPNCGIAIPARTGRGRRRIFCSEKCRSKYARQHPSQTSWRNIQDLTCEYCGGQFQVYQKTLKAPLVLQRILCEKICHSRETQVIWRNGVHRHDHL